MKIDYNYNLGVLKRIEDLVKLDKERYKIDLHIHTDYSADGVQTVEESIDKAIEHGFDIISITDHDSIAAYADVLEIEKNKENCPIIIPGIEFTVDFREYEGRCHILKYLFDMDNEDFMRNLAQNKLAYEKRVELWFERIQKNDILKYYSQKYDIHYSKSDYMFFLKESKMSIPEYPTLMKYLFSLLQKNGVDIWNVYDKVSEFNELDECIERKKIMAKELHRFWIKYKDKEVTNNYRKLRPLLAPVDLDDDNFKNFPPTGSLSIGRFGQVDIRDLNNVGINIFAHPSEEKLKRIDCVTDVINGLELNHRSSESTNRHTHIKSQRLGKIITKGSDKHDKNDEEYLDKDFYYISKEELIDLYQEIKEAIVKN